MSENIDKDVWRIAIGKIARQYLNRNLDHAEMLTATVNSVDINSRTCTVTTINGKESVDLENVELMAEVADGMLCIPTVESTVKIVVTKGLNPFVVQYSDLDQIINTVNGTVFKMDGQTFSMKTKTDSAVKIFSDLVDQVIQMVTNSTGGDGTLSPTSVQAFQQIKTRINQLFS